MHPYAILISHCYLFMNIKATINTVATAIQFPHHLTFTQLTFFNIIEFPSATIFSLTSIWLGLVKHRVLGLYKPKTKQPSEKLMLEFVVNFDQNLSTFRKSHPPLPIHKASCHVLKVHLRMTTLSVGCRLFGIRFKAPQSAT